jgi:glycosyltransferase involved in cell wall biosynthesis
MRILIAIPTFETIQPEVFKAVYDLHSAGHELSFDFVKGYDCAVARNKISVLAKGTYDYVLMVDSDTIIPPDTLELMLDTDVDICLGVCPRKNTKEGETAMVKMTDMSYRDFYHYDELPTEKTEVKGGGFACALIKTTVLTALDYPYFQYVTNEDCSTFSEDFYFCQHARLYGYQIIMDPRVKCGHLARYYQYE